MHIANIHRRLAQRFSCLRFVRGLSQTTKRRHEKRRASRRVFRRVAEFADCTPMGLPAECVETICYDSIYGHISCVRTLNIFIIMLRRPVSFHGFVVSALRRFLVCPQFMCILIVSRCKNRVLQYNCGGTTRLSTHGWHGLADAV